MPVLSPSFFVTLDLSWSLPHSLSQLVPFLFFSFFFKLAPFLYPALMSILFSLLRDVQTYFFRCLMLFNFFGSVYYSMVVLYIMAKVLTFQYIFLGLGYLTEDDIF